MNPILRQTTLVLLIAGTAGCSSHTTHTNKLSPNPRRETPNTLSAEAPGDLIKAGLIETQDKTDLFTLPAFEVKESAFSDFGMSVKTNLEVGGGGNVEWMLVSGVEAGSSAAKANLHVGDRILAIDQRLVSDLNRDEMLSALFQRKKGDRTQFLLLERRQPLPRFVTLVANRPTT